MEGHGARRAQQWGTLNRKPITSIRNEIKHSVEQRATELQGWLNSLHELIKLSENPKGLIVSTKEPLAPSTPTAQADEHWWLTFHNFNQFLFERTVSVHKAKQGRYKKSEGKNSKTQGNDDVARTVKTGVIRTKKRPNRTRNISIIPLGDSKTQ